MYEMQEHIITMHYNQNKELYQHNISGIQMYNVSAIVQGSRFIVYEVLCTLCVKGLEQARCIYDN